MIEPAKETDNNFHTQPTSFTFTILNKNKREPNKKLLLLIIYCLLGVVLGIFALVSFLTNYKTINNFFQNKKNPASIENSTNIFKISDKNQYMVNGKLISYDSKNIKIELKDKITLNMYYDNTSSFYFFKDILLDPKISTPSAKRSTILSTSDIILNKSNVNKNITVQYVVTNNEKYYIEQFYLE